MHPFRGGKPVEENEEIGLGIKFHDLSQNPFGSGPNGEPFVDDSDFHGVIEGSPCMTTCGSGFREENSFLLKKEYSGENVHSGNPSGK